MKSVISLSIILNCLLLVSPVEAQVSTLYFIKNTYNRHELNPAFQPETDFYIDLPLFPGMQSGAGNNSVSLGDVVYPRLVDGKMKTITFLHPQGDKDRLFNRLQSQTSIFADAQLNLFSVGFRSRSHFFTFGISQKVNAGVTIPVDLFRFSLYGTPDTLNVNHFDFKSLDVSASVFTEFAFGFSRKFDDRLSVGGKAKLLLGQANISTRFNNFELNAGRDKWKLGIDGSINAAIPSSVYTLKPASGKIESFDFLALQNIGQILIPSGAGFAFDLGATYKLMENLEISASILDLGAIRWNKESLNIIARKNTEFDGVYYNPADSVHGNYLSDFIDANKDSLYSTFYGSYSSGLPAKLILAAEYYVLKDKISLGLFLKSGSAAQKRLRELTTSVNFFPSRFFNASLSYSLFNGRFSNVGLALGGRLGSFNMYIAGDYLPLKFTPGYIPYKTQSFNFNTGIALVFGNAEKKEMKKPETD